MASFAEEIPVSKYLDIKDYHIQNVEDPGYSLKMDIMPFYDYMPSLLAIQKRSVTGLAI